MLVAETADDKSRIALTEHNGELRVGSHILAKRMGNRHKNSMTLIESYFDKFIEFGVVPFQTEKHMAGTNKRKPERFALLNEAQAFLLIALSRNSVRVAALRSALIMVFRKARYGQACQTLEERQKEASQSGRRLAQWRYDKPDIYESVSYLREQLQLPLMPIDDY